MKIVHLELVEANEFIAAHHRHHKPVVGHRFSIGARTNDKLVGVAIVGRPVSRGVDHRSVLEVTRLCTDGSKNACSFLYGAAARCGKELGYSEIQTYILDTELGTTLKASGWEFAGMTQGGSWNSETRPREDKAPLNKKLKYRRVLG